MSQPPTPPAAKARPMTVLRQLKRLSAVYLGVVLVLLFLENKLVYHPTPSSAHWQAPPANAGVEDVTLETADGTSIHGWWAPKPDARGAILYCHGNAGNISHRLGLIKELQQTLGLSVLAFDYPGYGKSEGSPSEAGCYAAADAAYAWLTQRVPPDEIVLLGKSLGGGVAVDLATRQPHRALVLLITFSSIPDVGQSQFPWVPARWLMRNRYDNLAKIGNCTRPIFIAHGDCDTLIPLALSQRLYEAATAPKRFFLMPGCGHAISPACFADLADFLRGITVEAPACAAPAR
ncbi:MAG: alpha/beta hydrolase [Gemmataceae bacterium]|nr:alpha/beta hydrolase [Gemmataceae bacterium]